MVGAEGVDQSIDIKFDGVGAFITDGQESVSLLDVGEGGGHGCLCRYL
jgi:hypothetical protein